MEAKQMVAIILNCFDGIEDITRKKIKKNLLKPIDSTNLELKIELFRLITKLKEQEVFIGKDTKDTLWFFMELWCVNGYKTGSDHIGKIMKDLSIKESKFRTILDSDDFKGNDEKIRLLRMIRFINSHDRCVDLNNLFIDILFWDDKKRIEWIKQYR